jgi:hypothetical protein
MNDAGRVRCDARYTYITESKQYRVNDAAPIPDTPRAVPYSHNDFQRFLGRPMRCDTAPFCTNADGLRHCERCRAVEVSAS